MILIPVKSLANAKQRLASVLDQPTRTQLAQAMLFDVLEALGTWANRPEVSIVTSDPFALELARRFHFQIIADNANRSETDAIEMATRFCEGRGVDSTLVIPGDIPLIQAGSSGRFWNPLLLKAPCLSLPGTDAAPTQPGGVQRDCFPYVLETIASNHILRQRAPRRSHAWCCRFRALLSISTILPTCANSRKPPAKPAPSASRANGT